MRKHHDHREFMCTLITELIKMTRQKWYLHSNDYNFIKYIFIPSKIFSFNVRINIFKMDMNIFKYAQYIKTRLCKHRKLLLHLKHGIKMAQRSRSSRKVKAIMFYAHGGDLKFCGSYFSQFESWKLYYTTSLVLLYFCLLRKTL